MSVRNFIEEVHLVLVEHKGDRNTMNRSIAPSFIEKATILIQEVEEVKIFLRSEEVQITDFKVRPLQR